MNYLPHLFAVLIGASLGQMVAALVVDHYDAIGFPENPVTLWRVVGVALLIVGVVLIMRR